MDVFEILQQDHARIRGLFKKLNQPGTKNDSKSQAIFDELRSEWTRHMEAEEQTLYKSMLDNDKARELVILAKEEHYVINSMLAELEMLPFMNREWRLKFTRLQAKFEGHITIEEKKVYTRARKALPEDELGRCRDAIESVKIAFGPSVA